MRLISMVILTVLCFAIPARSSDKIILKEQAIISSEHADKIVFENQEQVYTDLTGYKDCILEKSQLYELVDTQEKQIVLLNSGLGLCGNHSNDLDGYIKDLKNISESNKIYYDQLIKSTKKEMFVSKVKTIGISLIIGFLLGTSVNLTYWHGDMLCYTYRKQ